VQPETKTYVYDINVWGGTQKILTGENTNSVEHR